MSWNYQEVREMELKRGRQKEMNMSKKSLWNGSSGGCVNTNLIGVRPGRLCGVRFIGLDYSVALNLI